MKHQVMSSSVCSGKYDSTYPQSFTHLLCCFEHQRREQTPAPREPPEAGERRRGAGATTHTKTLNAAILYQLLRVWSLTTYDVSPPPLIKAPSLYETKSMHQAGGAAAASSSSLTSLCSLSSFFNGAKPDIWTESTCFLQVHR